MIGKSDNKNNIIYIIMGGLLFSLMVGAVGFAVPIADTVRNSIDFCLTALIPSLFFLMLLSDFAVKTNVLSFILRPFGLITKYIFRLDISLSSVIIFSMIGGYPVGAKLIARLVAKGKISCKTAERMLCFCVNSGPAFLISGVAIPLYSNVKIGIILFLSQILASFTVAFFTGIGNVAEKVKIPINKKPDYSKQLVGSVIGTVKSIALLCGFIIVFRVVITVLTHIGVIGVIVNSLSSFLPNSANAIVTGLLEVTTGTLKCAEIPGIASLITVCILTAFGGLCVHIQILAILKNTKVKMKKFYLTRIIYVFASVVYCHILMRLFDFNVSENVFVNSSSDVKIFSVSPFASVMLLLLSIMLLLTLKKKAE